MEGERDGQVVGETGADCRVGTIVRGMVENGDIEGNEGVEEKGRGDQETIEPRGLRVGDKGSAVR